MDEGGGDVPGLLKDAGVVNADQPDPEMVVIKPQT